MSFSKFRFFYVAFCWKRLRAYTNDILCINNACITVLLYCAILRRSPSHDSTSPAMIYIKTSSPHACQCKYSISVMKACIIVTYGDVSEKELLMFKFDVYFRNIEVINYF